MKTTAILLIALALIFLGALGFFPHRGKDTVKRVTVVYKISVPGRSYTMVAQTGARTVTMPAKTPNDDQFVLYCQYAGKDTVMIVPVTDSVYNKYRICDTIILKR